MSIKDFQSNNASTKISVVIPLYNKSNCIRDTIDSVLNQSFSNFELIIVNDGSTDNSAEIVSGINDRRLRLFNKNNQGVSSARNYGIGKATGEYIFFLDADDIIKPDCLEEFNSLTIEFPEASIYTANFIARHPAGDEQIICRSITRGYIDNPYKDLFKINIFPRTGSMLVKKICFDKVGTFLENLCKYEDLELNIRLIDNFRIVYSPVVVLVYNRGFSNLSSSSNAIEKEFASIINLKSSDFYKKLILAENLLSTIENKLLHQKKYNEVLYLCNKNFRHVFFLIYSFFILKLKIYR